MDSEDSGIYFSSADGGIEQILTDESFEDSLVFNLLFESRLVMPDIFFFNNKFLIRHLEGGGDDALFLMALAKGDIVPAFRYPDDYSLTKALQSISFDATLGIESKNYDSTAPEILAMRFDNAYLASGGPRGEGPARIVWPNDMGTLFGNAIERVILNDDPPIADERLSQYWNAMRAWRHDSIEVSRRETAALGGSGVRRAQMWNAVGWAEGWLDKGQSFPKPYTMIEAAARVGGPEMEARARLFVDVVNITYERNQADEFKVRHNVPGALYQSSPFVIGEVGGQAQNAVVASFSIDVSVPSAKALLAAGSANLLAIKAELEQDFSNRRKEWAALPTTTTEENLRAAALKYAEELTRWAHGTARPTRLSFFLTRGKRILNGVAGLAGTGTAQAAGLPTSLSIVSGLISIGATEAITTTLEVLADRRLSVPTYTDSLSFSTRNSAPEVNIPT